MPENQYILGIDVGGTFTDIELIDTETHAVIHHKISTTTPNPAYGVATGTRELLQTKNIDPKAIRYFAHGTTTATNAVAQGNLAPTGLITTKGFRDLIEIRRQRQAHLYNLFIKKPTPIVPRRWRLEIAERTYICWDSPVSPNRNDVQKAVRRLLSDGAKAIAICFLHSYQNPEHEKRAAIWARDTAPDIFICTSSEVLAEFREFERLSTTILNAALGPVMHIYLSQIEAGAKKNGLTIAPKILQSNGGITSTGYAARVPVRTLVSGPTAGVIGARNIGKNLNCNNLITLDIGGTTTDISLIEKGQPLLASEKDIAGYPARFPMIDVISIGAGGGSIAWRDAGGFLHVGPRSAGANPGPVCYQMGGVEPTVTDANLVLGHLNPDGLLGGNLPVNRAAARTAIDEKIAIPMGINTEEAAAAILTIMTENMVQAVRVASVERGNDPREFSLVAFGGGGPLMAGRLAMELEIPRVIIPSNPGLLSAQGLLVTDIRSDFGKTRITELHPDNLAMIMNIFSDLERQSLSWFKNERLISKHCLVHYAIDMRYQGQSHELRINIGQNYREINNVNRFSDLFSSQHKKLYGFSSKRTIELVTFRAVARSPAYSSPVSTNITTMATCPKVEEKHRRIFFEEDQRWEECPIFSRVSLTHNSIVHGPAIIEQMDTTTLIPKNQRAAVCQTGDLVLYVGDKDGPNDEEVSFTEVLM